MSKQQIQRTSPESGFWRGALLGTFAGMAYLLAFQYLVGILRRPRLISRTILSGEDRFNNQEAQAIFIAAESLQSGIQLRRLTTHGSKEILHAGYRNFSESWARDFGFAAYGLLTLKKFNPVKETLEAFFYHQTSEGQLPVKLHSVDVMTRFLHSFFGREQPNETILKPKYNSAHGSPSLDGQALLVIAALAYTRETGNTGFLSTHWDGLRAAMQWLGKFRQGAGDDPLLYQGAFADWADSIARRGRVLYSNVVYWKALYEMAVTATQLNLHQEAFAYYAQAENVLRAINRHFWREDLGYFVTSDELTQLSSDGNLLAIAWGLANRAQAERILQLMEQARMAEPIPTRVTYPAYPRHLIALENVLGGIGIYHTDASWLWIGAWHVIALVRMGYLEKAQQLVTRILRVIIEDRQVHEVHAPDGKPLSSIWYTSDAPLTWNAGMIIYACHLFRKHGEYERSPSPSQKKTE